MKLDRLEHYAKLCRVERVMRPCMEAILWPSTLWRIWARPCGRGCSIMRRPVASPLRRYCSMLRCRKTIKKTLHREIFDDPRESAWRFREPRPL